MTPPLVLLPKNLFGIASHVWTNDT